MLSGRPRSQKYAWRARIDLMDATTDLVGLSNRRLEARRLFRREVACVTATAAAVCPTLDATLSTNDEQRLTALQFVLPTFFTVRSLDHEFMLEIAS
ncbi:hypothetical protein Ae201684P_022308 [Aphanomyces euteiches]|nr:hypothetical protein Ae201684P_022308 [Aphanomyces euteiches]